ncbi:hypothetical protein [Streptomyces sp. NPDC005283]|uniref:hypothetical protein n=1 Tax=Streptomyces sp. NPDC005283 TaxID=3156871 RepID=UPI003451EF0D
MSAAREYPKIPMRASWFTDMHRESLHRASWVGEKEGLSAQVHQGVVTDAHHFAIDAAQVEFNMEFNGWTREQAEADQAFRMATVYIDRAIELAGDDAAKIASILQTVATWNHPGGTA